MYVYLYIHIVESFVLDLQRIVYLHPIARTKRGQREQQHHGEQYKIRYQCDVPYR